MLVAESHIVRIDIIIPSLLRLASEVRFQMSDSLHASLVAFSLSILTRTPDGLLFFHLLLLFLQICKTWRMKHFPSPCTLAGPYSDENPEENDACRKYSAQNPEE